MTGLYVAAPVQVIRAEPEVEMPIKRVLIVDDDDDIRTVSEMALKFVGKLEVVAASNGAEAVRLASEQEPDLILLDMMMPGMDGVETFKVLRAQPSTAAIPIIFMTAKVQTHEVAEYLKLGAAGVITKPFDPMTLADQVREMAAKAMAQ